MAASPGVLLTRQAGGILRGSMLTLWVCRFLHVEVMKWKTRGLYHFRRTPSYTRF